MSLIATNRSCGCCYYFVEKKTDACDKFRHGNVNRSRGCAQRASKRMKDESEGMDHSATYAAATCSKSSSCGQSHNTNDSFESKQVTEDSRYNVAEKVMEVQDVVAACTPDAEEQKSTETMTVSGSSQSTCRRIQTRPSPRLFQLSVQTVRDSQVQSAGQALSLIHI